MATLIYRSRAGATRRHPLFKKITTIGSGRDNDLVLDDPAAAGDHAHVHFDGQSHTIAALGKDDLVVNAKTTRSHKLHEGDVVSVGQSELRYASDAAGAEDDTEVHDHQVGLEAYRKLHDFSKKLAKNHSIPELLATLMDLVTEITHADKGFLVLIEDGQPSVKVARNLRKENIEDAVSQLSDSIMAKVVRSGVPVVVSDAQQDAEFKGSVSVINLRLSSVMCAPLMERGEVIGVIYLGNDRVVSQFEEGSLEVLSVFSAQASLILQNAMLVNALESESRELKQQLEQKRFGNIIGSCESMREVFKKVRKIAPTDVSVLITGETGTGKELIAQELHTRSTRAGGPFVVINCGAIPENLLESELFGHVKGAFTGAVATREGRFQAAHGGTLFLDEIGEMPLSLQVKLLRALQEKVVTKVGDTKPEPVDIRVVAATHKDLDEEIRGARFREDLFYRLNVVNLLLPPLRDRGDDLLVLGRYFLSRYAREYNSRVTGFAPNAIIAMKKFSWPGNIRQLENRIKKAVILAERALLSGADLDLKPEDLEAIKPLAEAKEEFQTRYINEVLARNNGNRTKTARDLGVDPRTIFRHLEKSEAGEEETEEA